MDKAENKRIARNTLILYVRLAVATGISLYTSRIILQTLGVVDYGIYGVVSGIVTLFTFLNSAVSGAASRFLTFELGRGNPVRLHETFVSAFILHAMIALVIALVAETVGLWFLVHQLVIPPERLSAAHWVYQLSIVAMVISVTQVPYNATIIAHEKMQIYAYVEILNAVLRLLIVYVLVLCEGDKLIIFAILVVCVPIITTLVYRIYCLRNFPECKLTFLWKPAILKPMLNFSGWDIYGNIGALVRTQGVNVLLNLFFGPALNAAANIAARLQDVIVCFSLGILTASRPQIVKQYAKGETDDMVVLLRDTLRVNFLLFLVASIPLLLEMDFVLKIWLGKVPAYTAIFCSYTLLFCFFSCISTVVASGIHATGRIKRLSLINGSLYLAVIPVSYLLFKNEAAPWASYLFNVVAVFIGMLLNAYTLRLYVPQFSLRTFVGKDLIPCLLVFMGVYAIGYLWCLYMPEGWIRLLLTCFLSTCLLAILGYLFLMPVVWRTNIKVFLRNRLYKNTNIRKLLM